MKGLGKKQLLQIIAEQAAQLKKRDEIIARQDQEIALLRQKVDLLVRRVFGPSSEKLDPSQIDLFLVEPENTPGKSVASSTLEEAEPPLTRRAASPRPHRWPQDLPVVEQAIDPEEVAAQPEQWRCIGSEADWCGANMSAGS
jgi:uncharacterized coiled-coil protein SlyX